MPPYLRMFPYFKKGKEEGGAAGQRGEEQEEKKI
jgi:hypothetical protein